MRHIVTAISFSVTLWYVIFRRIDIQNRNAENKCIFFRRCAYSDPNYNNWCNKDFKCQWIVHLGNNQPKSPNGPTWRIKLLNLNEMFQQSALYGDNYVALMSLFASLAAKKYRMGTLISIMLQILHAKRLPVIRPWGLFTKMRNTIVSLGRRL